MHTQTHLGAVDDEDLPVWQQHVVHHHAPVGHLLHAPRPGAAGHGALGAAAGGGVCCGMHGRGSAWRSCSIAHCGGSGWHAGGVAGIDERVCVANMRCARLGQRQAVCVVVGGDVAGARRAVDGGAAKHRLCGGGDG